MRRGLLCALGGDGFHHCTARTQPVLVACDSSSSGFPCCRSDADCSAMPRGRCLPYAFESCGGPALPPGNGCVYDECVSDSDCRASANGFCSAGFPRRCVYGPCGRNADCARQECGRCVMEAVGAYCQAPRVFCRYRHDPCARNDDCRRDGGVFTVACLPNADLQGESCQSVGPPPL